MVIRLLHLARIEVGKEHLVPQGTGVLIAQAAENRADAGVRKYRFHELRVIREVPEVLVGQDHVEAAFPDLVEHGRHVVRDVLLEFIEVEHKVFWFRGSRGSAHGGLKKLVQEKRRKDARGFAVQEIGSREIYEKDLPLVHDLAEVDV